MFLIYDKLGVFVDVFGVFKWVGVNFIYIDKCVI